MESLQVRLLCSIDWSWHCHWLSQSYRVQVQFERQSLPEKVQKNKGPSQRTYVSAYNDMKTSDSKSTKALLALQNNPAEHKSYILNK